MDTKAFEERRWGACTQQAEFRHRAALDLVPGGTVLDVGCGDGLLLRMLRSKGIEARGVDLSERAAQLCRADNFDVQVGDFMLEPLPFEDRSVDYVVALDVLEHVYEPEILLKEMKRVARSGVIIGVPNFSSLPARLQMLRGLVPENNNPNKGHIYWFNYYVLKSLCKSAGLHVDALKTNTFFPFSWFWRHAPVFPNLLALSFVVRLTKRHE